MQQECICENHKDGSAEQRGAAVGGGNGMYEEGVYRERGSKRARRSFLTRVMFAPVSCRIRDERVEQDVAGYDSSRLGVPRMTSRTIRLRDRPLARPRSAFVSTR